MESILGKQYVTPLLVRLLEGESMMTQLSDIVSNYSTLRLVIRDLKDVGYVEIQETFQDKRKIFIYLTEKGRAVAEHLKRAEDVSKGKKFVLLDKFAIISFLDKTGSSTLPDLRDEFLVNSEILRGLEDLKIIKQEIDSSKHPPVNLISLTKKGKEIAELLTKIESILEG